MHDNETREFKRPSRKPMTVNRDLKGSKKNKYKGMIDHRTEDNDIYYRQCCTVTWYETFQGVGMYRDLKQGVEAMSKTVYWLKQT